MQKCKRKDFLLTIICDTSRIIVKDIDGHIDEKKSLEFLYYAIDNLYLETLIGFTGTLDFKEQIISIPNEKFERNVLFGTTRNIAVAINQGESNRSVSDALATSTVTEIKNNLILMSWAQRVKAIDFLNSPFESISYESGKNGCIFITSIDINLDDQNARNSPLQYTSNLVKEAFLSHIERVIKYKMECLQNQPGSAFILAIMAEEWRFSYENDYDDFVPVRNRIQSLLKNYAELTGVILFTKDIYLGKYIENSFALHPVKLEDLVKNNIIDKHVEPLITHDRKIDLSNLDCTDKVNRIRELLSIESYLESHDDGTSSSYARDDREELLENIRIFLNEKSINQTILNELDPIIKKYCFLKTDIEELGTREDLITDSRIFALGNIPLRAYASACQVLLTRHNPTTQNIELSLSLFKDTSSYVRQHVCKELEALYEIIPEKALELANQYCSDNKYVRWHLRFFLVYLYHKNRKQTLRLLVSIITLYGSKTFVGEGESTLPRFAVKAITQTSIQGLDSEYEDIFVNLITNDDYNMDIKKEVIASMRDEKFISDSELSNRVISYYQILLQNKSIEIKAHVEFFLLHQLVVKNISLFPRIRKLLGGISAIKYPIGISSFDRTYHFMILEYLDKFCLEFPVEAANYLIQIITRNEFLLKLIHVHHILDIIEKLTMKYQEKSFNDSFIKILRKIDSKTYWKASILLEKLESG